MYQVTKTRKFILIRHRFTLCCMNFKKRPENNCNKAGTSGYDNVGKKAQWKSLIRMMKLHIKISVIFFSVDKDPEVSFDDESNEFLMP